MTTRLKTTDNNFADGFAKLLAAKRENEADVNDTVTTILADVRERGDAALIEMTRRFDGFELTAEGMAIGADEIDAAMKQCEPALLAALELAASRISDFHKHQMPENLDYVDAAGIRLGYRWTALAAAGLYVPGGTAAYPSSVLMNALPAKVAGVERLVMVVPTPAGVLNPLVLAAARIAGIDEIYRIGGAPAGRAHASGTAALAPVGKSGGPGHADDAAAKRPGGLGVGAHRCAPPSRNAGGTAPDNDPDWIATDLLSQAEHDKVAQAILITDDENFADRVETSVEDALRTLPRADIAGQSWHDYGALIVVENLDEAIPLIDRIAPEHLELAVADPDGMAAKVRNAGAIFLGRFAPEALGDYLAGPNHVLPTDGSARFSSGLGVLDFIKRSSLIGGDAKSLAEVGPAAILLAEAEGLDAHARSIALRLNRRSEE
ncbi:MAG: histidinol dehydrogenase [Rhodospirillaceae bacterium]|nr:histidinol dehydrogenase [Rhodospirillaceae bacterium]